MIGGIAHAPRILRLVARYADLWTAWAVNRAYFMGEYFMRTDDLQGAIWIPGDGKANPADLCMSLAKGARQRGVTTAQCIRAAASTAGADSSRPTMARA